MTAGRPLVMWGASGQARVLCELIVGQPYQAVAFVDEKIAAPPIPGAVMMRDVSDLTGWVGSVDRDKPLAGTLAMGWVSEARLALGQTMEALGIELVTLIHETAWIARNAEVGRGCQILAGARVCAGALVGANAIVNTGALIDHDTVVGEGSHVTPGVIIAGEAVIGRNVFLGAGSIVLPRIRIGDGAMVAAGAVVTRNVAAGETVVGLPARVRDHSSKG